MDPTTWEQVKDVFHEALTRPSSEREQVLARCPPAIRSEVETQYLRIQRQQNIFRFCPVVLCLKDGLLSKNLIEVLAGQSRDAVHIVSRSDRYWHLAHRADENVPFGQV